MDEPMEQSRDWRASPFWIAIMVLWVLMVALAVTLALALGIWSIVEAF